MSDQVTVVAVNGSLRADSKTRLALEAALRAADRAGASTELIDLREYELPLYDADNEDPEDAERLTRKLRAADSILLGTPVYHGSYSSVLKTALDYSGFDEFEDTTVGLLAVAGGGFPVTALDHLRSVCRSLSAWVIPHQAAVPNSHDAFVGGEIADDNLAERTEVLGQRVVQYANIEPDPMSFEGRENVGADD
ncbi:MAG: NAD(P)H-dependent oxidoreductase [Halobacteriales archaeon]